MTKYMRISPVVLVLLGFTANTQAQRNKAGYEHTPACDTLPRKAPDPTFPMYTLQRLDSTQAQRLRNELNHECWEQALRTYYSGVRLEQLPNWVVYINKNGVVHQGVTRNRSSAQHFRDERYFWIVVFADSLLPKRGGDSATSNAPGAEGTQVNASASDTHVLINIPGAAPDTPSDTSHGLILKRRSIEYHKDPLLTGLVKAIAAKFFSAPDAGQQPTLADSAQGLSFEVVTQRQVVDTLYVAQARFGLSEDTKAEFSLHSGPGREFPGNTRQVYTMVGNASPSLWEVGIALGGSFGPEIPKIVDDSVEIGRQSGSQPNIYLTTYLNLLRPSLPWHPVSLGLVAGTNIARGGLLDDILTGVAIGRIVGDAGFTVGADFRSVTYVRANHHTFERRRPRLFVALDVRL